MKFFIKFHTSTCFCDVLPHLRFWSAGFFGMSITIGWLIFFIEISLINKKEEDDDEII